MKDNTTDFCPLCNTVMIEAPAIGFYCPNPRCRVMDGANTFIDLKSKDRYKTAIFSGRFDPPHLGHMCTILKLTKRFSKVVVVILDYDGRLVLGATDTQDIMNFMFDTIFPEIARSKIDVVTNDVHFGKITFYEYDIFLRNIGACYNHTVFLSGNKDVLKNMKAQQIKHEFIDRSIDSIYSGTKIRQERGIE